MVHQSIVAPTDPRLGLRIAPASPQDPETHAAVRLLGDVMAELRAGVLSAPAVGIPLNLVAVRDLDVTRYFLNPTVAALGPLEDVRGEAFCLTGAIRRNTQRARWLILRGMDLAGVERELELEEDLALRAQQAFDLLHGRSPDTWLTPFHRACLAEREPARRALLGRINQGLCLAKHGQDAPVRPVDPGTVCLMSDVGDSAVGPPIRIDNPDRPIREVDRIVLGLLDALPEVKHTLFTSPGSSGLMVASMVLHRRIVVYRPKEVAWPDRALQHLGLDRYLNEHSMDPQGSPCPQARLHAIVVDCCANASEAVPDQTVVRPMSRVLDGEAGMFLVTVPSPDAGLEDVLQAAFQAVYAICLGPEADQTVYLAMKKTPDLSNLRARILSSSRGPHLQDRSALLRRPWTHLRKDGRRDAA